MRIKSIIKVGILAAMIVVIGSGLVYQERVSIWVMTQLQDQIYGDITYGDYSIALFRSFPNVRADFNQLTVHQNEKVVIDVDRFTIELDLFKLLNKVVKINGIRVQSGDLHVIRDQTGRTNIERLFSSGTSDAEAQPIYLHDIDLSDVHVRYQDLITADEYRLHVDKGNIDADIQKEYIKIKAEGQGEVDFLLIADLTYCEKQPFELAGDIRIMRSDNIYHFDKVDLRLDDNTCIVNGDLQLINDGAKYNIELSQMDAELASLIRSLPALYADYLIDYRINGRAEGHVRISGIQNTLSNPKVSLVAQLRDARINILSKDMEINGVSGKLTYNNGDEAGLASSVLHAADISSNWQGQQLSSNFTVQDFIAPIIDGTLSGEVKLNLFSGFFKKYDFIDVEGSVFINRLSLKNYPISTSGNSTEIHADQFSIKCSLRDLSATHKGQILYVGDGELELIDDTMTLTNAHVLVGQSDFNIQATINHMYSGLMQHQQQANLSGNVTSKNVDALDLWKYYGRVVSPVAKVKHVATSSQNVRPWYNRLNSTITLSVDHMSYDQLSADRVISTVHQNGKSFKWTSVSSSFDGDVDIAATGQFAPNIEASASVDMNDVQVTDLFKQFKNFDQEFIEYNHLSGRMNIKSLVGCRWDAQGNFKKDDLEVDAYMDVRNGRLKDLDILNQFSKYIDIDELQDIKFSKLSNLIQVRRQGVFIPAMYIQNSACNMMVSGHHSIDQKIHYNIKVNAGQTIGNKLFKRKEKGGIVSSRKDGWFNMYFNIYGTVENYDYELNKSLVLRGFKHGEEKKKEIITRLTDIYGPLNQFEQPLQWLDIPAYNEGSDAMPQGEIYLDDF